MMVLVILYNDLITNRPTGQQVDPLIELEGAFTKPTYCPISLFAIKIIDLPVFEKSVTCGPTDGRTDGRMDKPGYRDARTHLIN